MADLVTQADVEAFYPPVDVRQLFSDNGSATPGPRLATAITAASARAKSVLLKGWPSEAQVEQLVAADPAAKHAVCRLVMAIGYEGRVAYNGPQGNPAATLEKLAITTLEQLVAAQLRSVGEATAGKNPMYADRVTTPDPNFIFAPSGGTTPRGGF